MIPLTPLVPVLDRLLNRLIPDDEARNAARDEMLAGLSDAQLRVNAVEAAHRSLFVAGWRPFIGWVCGAALAWHYLLEPLLGWGSMMLGLTLPPLPRLDWDNLWSLLVGMLGLGGLRSWEKARGVSR